MLVFGDRRSRAGFAGTDRGERSTEALVVWRGEGESVSDLATPLLSLLTLGVAGDVLLIGILVAGGVSEEEDLDLADMMELQLVKWRHLVAICIGLLQIC